METQTDGIMPDESKNLSMKFKCKKCGHMIAMLTNKFETEFVSKLGVEVGGASSVGTGPLSMVGSQLAQAKKELDKGKPEDNLVWSEEAQLRIKKVPFFVRNMAKKTVINFALEKGVTLIDAKLMDEVREKVGM
ncbi:MAG: PCP reductase family protein [Nitrospinae bacterium]|nr:PCP reductase family protein [Nitrospinota bacterium]